MPRRPPASSGFRRVRIWLLSALILLQALLALSQAQITLDGSLGPPGPLAGPNYRIGAELGQIRGGNLFHSFGAFNVPIGGSATFAGPNTIANIVGRVTGGQPSSIDGVLRSEIAGAHLYLLNPSGVMFGSNARLEVSGSFHVSTADYLHFADGATFSAHLGQASVLTVAEPAAFGFLSANPAAIAVQGSTLQVPAGNVLSVVGGDVTILGTGGPGTENSIPTLGAPSGRIHLASVASPGEVAFSPLELAPDLQVDAFARLGRLALSQGALVTVGTAGSRNAGEIAVRGGQLTLSSGSRLSATTSSSGEGGRIVITAPTVSLLADGRIEAGTEVGSRGNGGAIEVRVGTLTLTEGARISSSTNGPGQAGTVTVAATEAITLAGHGSNLSGLSVNSNSRPSGDTSRRGAAGRIVISAPTVSVAEGEITARALSSTSGNAGAIEVRAGTVTLTEGARISSSTRGPGRGGPVTVAATEAITIAGRRPGGRQSGFSSDARSSGEAGRIVVSAPRLSMRGGEIQTQALSGSGNAGAIEVRAGTVTLTEGARIVSNTVSSGNGGRIVVTAPRLSLEGGRIEAGTGERSPANGGTIAVEVDTLTLTDGGSISSSTSGTGRGGSLTVTAREAILIAGQDSRLSIRATSRGEAGRIVVSTPILRLDDGGIIRANSTGAGSAGTIELRVGTLTLTNGGTITTSTTGSGQGGPLTITAREAILIAGHGQDATPSRLVSTTEGPGPGGNLQIVAQRIELRDGGTIAASSTGDGAAGMLVLDIGETFRSQGGRVTTQSGRAGGGRLELHAGSLIQLIDSELTSAVEGGRSDAGNIFLDAPFVVLDQSLISANASAGRGGNVLITAEAFLADPASRVSASSDLGIQGTVDIRAPVTTLSGTLAPLPQTFVNVAALLPARCAARLSGGQTSSLVLGGRDGLPADPSGVLPSPLALEERLVADPTVTGAPQRQQSAARFALLAGHEQGLPRLAGACAK